MPSSRLLGTKYICFLIASLHLRQVYPNCLVFGFIDIDENKIVV